MDTSALRQFLLGSFNIDELRDLCFTLKINHEDLGADNRSALARELIAYCERHARLAELESTAQQLADDYASGQRARPASGTTISNISGGVNFEGSVGGDVVGRDKIAQHITQQIIPMLRATPPAPPAHFTGREADLKKFTRLITSGQNVAIIALHGMGGIGKTSLALKLAERLRDDFPGGVLWWSLGPNPDVITALDVWARHADPNSNLKDYPTAEARAEIVRPMLAKLGKLCVIIDDVWDAKSVRVLQEALPPDSVILLTTRNAQVAGALGCHVERVERLSPAECLELLSKLYAPQSLESHDSAAKDIVEIIDGLPLALKLIRGLADTPARLPRIVEKLRQKPVLDILKLPEDEGREASLEWCLALSYTERLNADMQRRFRALGAFARAPYDRAAIAAVWDKADEEAVTDAIEYLVQRNLLEEDESTQEYSQHALLWAYSLALLEKENEHHAAAARHADYYRRFAKTQNWRAIEHAFDQIEHGWQWVQKNSQDRIVEYVSSLQRYIDLRGRKTNLLNNLLIGLKHAKERKNVKDEANLLSGIGTAIFYLRASKNALQDSLDYFRTARDIYLTLGDMQSMGEMLNNIGGVYDVAGKKQEALSYYRQALDVFQQLNDEKHQGASLNNIGVVYENLGQKQTAQDYFGRALEMHRRTKNSVGEIIVLNNMGQIYFSENQPEMALRLFQKALMANREIGDRWIEKALLSNLGRVLYNMELFDAAVNCLDQAVRLAEVIEHPELKSDRTALELVQAKLVTS